MQGEFERDRYKYKQTDFINVPKNRSGRPTKPPKKPAEEPIRPVPSPARKRREFKSLFLAVLILLIVLSGAIGSWRYLINKDAGPIPKDIRQSVGFPIYYPDPKKLPIGYTLDLTSFKNPVKNGVSYSITYGQGQKIVFSVQAKPADSVLQNFNNNYIPLNISFQTPVGEAKIGAYNNGGKIPTETLVSLPTNDNTWLIITTPYSINQSQLKQILLLLRT